ncbi:MAG: nuclear transport factor 2 family protein [Gemmatimonadaceae bacterium]
MKRLTALALSVALVALVAVPAHAQKASPQEKDVLKAHQALDEASIIKKDRAIMERLYANDYSYTHSNGTVLSKMQEIEAIMSPDQAWTAHKTDELKARIYGNVAVVTGLSTLTGSSKLYASGPRRFTELWVRRNGRWQLMGGQSTLVPAK